MCIAPVAELEELPHRLREERLVAARISYCSVMFTLMLFSFCSYLWLIAARSDRSNDSSSTITIMIYSGSDETDSSSISNSSNSSNSSSRSNAINIEAGVRGSTGVRLEISCWIADGT